jgi:hypothetical protein
MNGKLVIPKIQDYDFLKDHGMIEGIMPTAPAPE